MITKAFIAALLLFGASTPVFSQFEQMRRSRERMDRSVRANEEAEKRRTDDPNETVLPVPKAARMNVDVQSVLAAQEYKTFAEARTRAVSRVADGYPLWLYLKFNGRLGDYVVTTRDVEDPSTLRYTLYAEIGPKGDITALSQYAIRFNKEDLSASEFKIALAPVWQGRNRFAPLFLRAADAAKSGLWSSELRVSNLAGFPRGPADHLASTPLLIDLRGGNSKYKRMFADYDSILLRGSTDTSIVPPAGTFFDQSVRMAIDERLRSENIVPAEVYFTGDEWWDASASSPAALTQARRVFAVFTYKTGAGCFYGLAEAVETLDAMTAKFGPPQITLTKGMATSCPR